MQQLRSWGRTFLAFAALVLDAISLASAAPAQRPPPGLIETPVERAARHRRVAQRRARTVVMCHRGAGEFGIENTLEAYEAAFQLGADGIEIDLRRTPDGAVVLFHDDMLDRLLDGFGQVSDLYAAELARMRGADVDSVLPNMLQHPETAIRRRALLACLDAPTAARREALRQFAPWAESLAAGGR